MAEAANMAELLGGLDFRSGGTESQVSVGTGISGFAMTRTINTLK